MINIIKSALKFIVGVNIAVVGVVILRTIYISRRISRLPPCKADAQDYINMTDAILKRFQDAIGFRTISFSRDNANYEEISKYIDYLVSVYPRVHSSPLVTRTVVANYSVLYTIRGADSSLTPYLFSTHSDVVPADLSNWTTDPFVSQIIDGYIYGRGTIDFKNGIHGILEALEFALANKFIPRRSFFFTVGHDEELGGHRGASAISEYMRTELGVNKLEFVLDEGAHVLHEAFKGMQKPFALVGVTEKGFAHLELSVSLDTGHSSMPSTESSIGILARAIHRLESNQFPSMLWSSEVDRTFIETIGQQTMLPMRLVMSNTWLFSPLITFAFSFKPPTNALIRTTTAITTFHAGVKDNVIAPSATARVNHRIHSEQRVREVIARDRKLIADDRVKIRVVDSKEAHPTAPHDLESFGFQTVRASIQQVFPGLLVAPGVMIGNTDSSHYLPLTSSIYRFCFTESYPVDLKRLHGFNERISVKNYEKTINFYYNIMKNADESGLKELYRKHSEL